MKHLKITHHVDPEANGVAQKRDENNTAVYAVILRHAEINKAQKAQDEAQKKEQILSLNKTTLEYLYIRRITTHSLAFNQVTHSEFRDFV